MPSPRNSCPAPSRSFLTSSLNDRSAICLLLARAFAPLLRIDLGCRHHDYIKRTCLQQDITVQAVRAVGGAISMRLPWIAGLAIILTASSAAAQEITLRAVSAFAEGTEFSKNFERFIERVNSNGKGIIKINYIGGPRAVPPFEVGNAVRTRVIDIANVTGAFYTNLMPEADG